MNKSLYYVRFKVQFLTLQKGDILYMMFVYDILYGQIVSFSVETYTLLSKEEMAYLKENHGVSICKQEAGRLLIRLHPRPI